MGEKVTFDSVTRIIKVTSPPVNGTVELDVATDLYSDGKEDWIADKNLRRLAFPIKAVGGNPLPGSDKLGTTYFLRSDWKIEAYSGNHSWAVNGNIFSEDGSSPFIAPSGSYSIFLQNKVSNLVDSKIAQLSEIEHATFSGSSGPGVHIKPSTQNAGTAYPVGNSEYPCNNVQDAVAIAASRGLSTIYLHEDLVLDSSDDVSNFRIIGKNNIRTTLTINAAAVCSNAEITDLKVTGNLDGESILDRCVIDTLSYIDGEIRNSRFNATTLTLNGSNPAYLINCSTVSPTLGTFTIDMNGAGNADTPLTAHKFTGEVRLIQKTGAGTALINLSSGKVIIDSSCTAGTIIVRGDGKVVDHTDSRMATGVYNGGVYVINETTGSGMSEGTIASAVWNYEI